MVQIDYINGDREVIATEYSSTDSHFHYDKDIECFIVHDKKTDFDRMMIPREFVKSIRHIK